MSNVIRVALPGYNALSDTNLDHFALYTDQDNVLIKEFSRGSLTLPTNPPYAVAHNLGYIPFFLAYVFDIFLNKWLLAPNYAGGASVPPYAVLADTTNLYFYVNDGNTYNFKYYIFYDNVVGSSGITLTESNKVIKIAKSGFNALTEKDPNNLIFHSDLNTFKILKEANASINYTVDGSYTFAHNAGIANPTSYFVFVKFPDGFTTILPGAGVVYSKDSNWHIFNTYIDTLNIGMTINGTGVATTLPFKYYVFETPLT